VDVIRDFYSRRGVQTQVVEIAATPIDLDEIWDDEEA
jgi:hypothetical protein